MINKYMLNTEARKYKVVVKNIFAEKSLFSFRLVVWSAKGDKTP